MKLVYENDKNTEVKVGDKVKTFRGDEVQVESFREPHHAGSTGRVYVRHSGATYASEYFPGVIGACWID